MGLRQGAHQRAAAAAAAGARVAGRPVAVRARPAAVRAAHARLRWIQGWGQNVVRRLRVAAVLARQARVEAPVAAGHAGRRPRVRAGPDQGCAVDQPRLQGVSRGALAGGQRRPQGLLPAGPERHGAEQGPPLAAARAARPYADAVGVSGRSKAGQRACLLHARAQLRGGLRARTRRSADRVGLRARAGRVRGMCETVALRAGSPGRSVMLKQVPAAGTLRTAWCACERVRRGWAAVLKPRG